MNFPLLPYSTMVANGFLWTFYGLLVNERKIWVTNCLGCCLGCFYFYQFQKYCSIDANNLPGKISYHLRGVVLFIVVVITIPFTAKSEMATSYIGKLGVIVCIGLFSSPLAKLKIVLQTKSASSIPFPFTIACCINCFLWSVFGWWGLKDFYVYFPNGVGLFFGIVQLFLKILYNNDKSDGNINPLI